jgi:squalene synthase HpnC
MTAATGSERPAEGLFPGEGAVLPLAEQENFRVAARVLGRETGSHLLAIYGFARLVDQLGDEAPDNESSGDRLALLDALGEELDRVYADAEPRHPLMQRLAVTVRARDLPRGPFERLIQANRRDQQQSEYATFAELVDYCTLSANPVGELVLHVFGAATPERVELSDRVCTGLQLVEHSQDVAEDYGRGRIYLPAEDRERFGVSPADLGARETGAALRELMAFEVRRARDWLDRGAPLVGTLRGRARFAVAGYVGGGRANAAAVEDAAYDVLAGPPKASGRKRVRATLRTWRTGR